MLYLDHAATTPVKAEVLQAAWPWLTQEFGNPNSTHEFGLRAANALDWARTETASVLGCRSNEIIFTSGGTESNNLAIKGIALANPRGKHLVSALTEHSSVLESLRYLERVHGFTVTWLRVDNQGRINLTELQDVLTPETTLVTLMAANNEIGTLHQVKDIATLCKLVKVPFHCDAVQAAGWQDLNFKDLGVTSAAFSGHKFGAPKGSGLLYLSSRVELEPQLSGGGQEFERRSGTQNVAWAVAVATALAKLEAPQTASARVRAVTSTFIDEVLQTYPTARLTGTQAGLNRHPGIASFTFEGLNGETLLLELENNGIACSSGSACAAGSTEPSHVLLALGISPDTAQTSVRFSFGHEATMADARTALDALALSMPKFN